MESMYKKLCVNTDGVSTKTSIDQAEIERTCTFSMLPLHVDELSPREIDEFKYSGILNASNDIVLIRERHINFLRRGLRGLPSGYVSLDASRPWIIYWITHSLDLLDALEQDMNSDLIGTLKSCQNTEGGFGGGPQQMSHCAPTYAGVLTLLLLGIDEAYEAINRPALYRFFISLKHPCGGFRMHEDGETDVRGTYTVISIASLLNMLTPELIDGVGEYVLSTQTYEGGFGGEPWNEAHGGYAFCAFATLCILGRANEARLDCMEFWLVHRQMKMEGGFQGRTNKLVDGCYSFWQGSTLALLEYVRRGQLNEVTLHTDGNEDLLQPDSECAEFGEDVEGDDGITTVTHMVSTTSLQCGNLAFSQIDLQRYILLCAQQTDGGLRDKPGKSRDHYHTCYNLSGLSVAQHCLSETPNVLGDSANELKPTNPLYNITQKKAKRAANYFRKMLCEHSYLISEMH